MNFGGTVKLNSVGISLLIGMFLIFFLYLFVHKPNVMDNEINLKHLLAASIYVAMEGGKSIRIFDDSSFSRMSKGKTKEGANDFVTDADYRSHCVMYYGLKWHFPTIKVVSEEVHPIEMCQRERQLGFEKISLDFSEPHLDSLSNVYASSRDITVWIDPLDATQEFTEHLTEYVTTMVCVAVKGKPIIGVIHQPFDEQSATSWAWIKYGKSQNLNQKRPINFKTEIDYPELIVSRSHRGEVESFLRSAFPKGNITFAGGAGYKVLQLMEGKASAYIHTTDIKKWDVCAGDAILKAVGGQLSTLKNENIDYSRSDEKINEDGILAASSIKNHKRFYKQLKSVYPS